MSSLCFFCSIFQGDQLFIAFYDFILLYIQLKPCKQIEINYIMSLSDALVHNAFIKYIV